MRYFLLLLAMTFFNMEANAVIRCLDDAISSNVYVFKHLDTGSCGATSNTQYNALETTTLSSTFATDICAWRGANNTLQVIPSNYFVNRIVDDFQCDANKNIQGKKISVKQPNTTTLPNTMCASYPTGYSSYASSTLPTSGTFLVTGYNTTTSDINQTCPLVDGIREVSFAKPNNFLLICEKYQLNGASVPQTIPNGYGATVITQNAPECLGENLLQLTTQSTQTSTANNDLNGDTRSDLLWHNDIIGEIYLYGMNGITIDSANSIATNINDLEPIATDDFNGDGKTDILIRNKLSDQKLMYAMDGHLITSITPVSITSDINLIVVGSGDFNADGKADLLFRHSITGDNWLYLMDGATILSSTKINTLADLNWKVVGTADFNNDGKEDILWHNSSNGRVWMYLMDGTNIVTSNHVAFTSLDWVIQATGDLDNDGKEDIIWRNNSNGRIWGYLMNGVVISTSAHIAFSSLSWDIQATGDYNGDKKVDIFFRNNVTGQNWMYLMNGLTILVDQEVNTIQDLNWNVINHK